MKIVRDRMDNLGRDYTMQFFFDEALRTNTGLTSTGRYIARKLLVMPGKKGRYPSFDIQDDFVSITDSRFSLPELKSQLQRPYRWYCDYELQGTNQEPVLIAMGSYAFLLEDRDDITKTSSATYVIDLHTPTHVKIGLPKGTKGRDVKSAIAKIMK